MKTAFTSSLLSVGRPQLVLSIFLIACIAAPQIASAALLTAGELGLAPSSRSITTLSLGSMSGQGFMSSEYFNSETVYGAASSQSVSVSAGPGTVEAKAYADQGRVGVYVETNAEYSGPHSFSYSGNYGLASAYYDDAVILAIPVEALPEILPDFVDVTLRLDIDGFLLIGGAANGDYGYINLSVGGSGGVNVVYTFPPGEYSTGMWGGVPDIAVVRPIHEELQMIVRLGRNANNGVHQYYTASAYWGMSASSGIAISGHWSQKVDALHTLSLQGVLLEDGSTPESQGYSLYFASGMQSPNLFSTVPEPASLTLLGFGALGIAFSAYRGRRRAVPAK